MGSKGHENNKIDPSSVINNVKANYKQEIIRQLLCSSFEDNKIKLSSHALSAIVEVTKCLVTETCLRAANQALKDGSDKIDIEQLEKCLPQLMLDFP